MIVVSDSSPLILLSHIGQLDLLRQLYASIIAPSAVYEEVAVSGIGKPGWAEIQSQEWINVRQVEDRTKVNSFLGLLHLGEVEAIVLAAELNASLLLMDERKGRKLAVGLGLKVTGTLGVLIQAKSNGYIQNVKPFMDQLITTAGFHLTHQVYDEVLQIVGED
jgi:predicted nucleic acid-binding protein